MDSFNTVAPGNNEPHKNEGVGPPTFASTCESVLEADVISNAKDSVATL